MSKLEKEELILGMPQTVLHCQVKRLNYLPTEIINLFARHKALCSVGFILIVKGQIDEAINYEAVLQRGLDGFQSYLFQKSNDICRAQLR